MRTSYRRLHPTRVGCRRRYEARMYRPLHPTRVGCRRRYMRTRSLHGPCTRHVRRLVAQECSCRGRYQGPWWGRSEEALSGAGDGCSRHGAAVETSTRTGESCVGLDRRLQPTCAVTRGFWNRLLALRRGCSKKSEKGLKTAAARLPCCGIRVFL